MRLTLACLVAVLPTLASAQTGVITGHVDAVPARFLGETVVFLKLKVAPSGPPRHVTIDQKGMRFTPHVTLIEVGDSVEFTNHDAVEHNVFTPDNEGYNLGMIKPNSAGRYTFEHPGVYMQLCSVHAEMLAYVFVGESPHHAVVDAAGNFRLEHVPTGSYEIAIWNSHLKAAEQRVMVVEGKPAIVNFEIKRQPSP
jgi:plastocyanin